MKIKHAVFLIINLLVVEKSNTLNYSRGLNHWMCAKVVFFR